MGAPLGCIWIPSCKQVFGSVEEWANSIGGQDDIFEDYREQLGPPAPDAVERVGPFDYTSIFYDFAFLMNGKLDPKLVRGEDNGASFADSRRVSLAAYLDMLVASKGSVQARCDAFAS